MDEKISVLVLKVKGKGCRSCVLPSKRLFLNVKGVKGVQVLGNLIAVIYNSTYTSSSRILSESLVQEFYDVEIVSEEHNIPLSNIRKYLEKIADSYRSLKIHNVV